MKKYLCVAVAFFGMLFVSCESENEGFVNVPQVQTLLVEKNSPTLEALAQYNSSQKGGNIETRGFWDRLKRILKIVSADVVGAGAAILSEKSGLGALTELNATVGTVATVVVGLAGGVGASITAASNSDCPGIVQYEPRNQVLNKVITCDKQNLIIIGPQKDYSKELPGDNLFAQIDYPEGMDVVKATGVYHNLVINNSELRLRSSNSFDLNGNGLEDDAPDAVYEELDNLVESKEYASVFNSAWNSIPNYMETDGFNYSSYFNSVYPTACNVKSTYLLFLQALNDNTSITSLSDVIDLVNDYVDIIEANNEFTQEEREQIYAGMAVAAYSYKLWSDKVVFADVEPIVE